MICEMTLKDRAESIVIALRQKRLRWFTHVVRREEGLEIMNVLEKDEEREAGR